ncbi:Na+ driven multidrug efflux pump [Helicobacter mustelae]|uniref:MATE family efflux transporter n=1 Tax=Helicobacter mustelae TaxID=217 RepID=UPI000DFDBC5C|nr:MATE family efflux transporter [Helicobacter mustelae]STP13283.1 Na+ driven multidrug efflux pump [Helicobacter mustelae]
MLGEKPLRLNPALKHRLKKIIALALPSGINSFLDIFNIAIVLYFISDFGDLEVLAVGISLNYLILFFAIHAIFYVGTNAQISRYFGAKEYDKIRAVFLSVCTGGLLIAMPMIYVGRIGAGIFLDWMGMGQEVSKMALDYTNIIIYALPSIMLKNIIISSLAGIGNTYLPLFIRLFNTILGFFLNYICIFGMEGLGIEGRGMLGAGIANLIIAYFEILIFFIVLYFRTHFLDCLTLQKKYFFKALRIGIPSGIERFLTIFSIILTGKLIANYGDLVLAGSQIGARIEAFSFMPGFGFMIAAMVLMGQNLGANKAKLAGLYIRTILGFSSIVMGISGILLVYFSRDFSKIFSANEVVLQNAVYYLFAVGLSQIPMICCFVFDGALRGAGITKITLAINTISIWVGRILPMSLVVWLGGDILWIFAIIFTETYIRAIIFYLVFRTGIWRRAGSEI